MEGHVKRLVTTVAVTLTAAAAYGMGSQPNDKPPAEKAWSHLRSEVSIRKLYDEFESSWNAHDAKGMARFWAPGGDHYQPDGRIAEGRDAVQALFQEEQSGPYKESTLSLSVRSVWMITPNVALVNGTYAVNGVRDREGKEIAIRKGLLTAVLLKEGDRWWIAASRAMIPVPLPYR